MAFCIQQGIGVFGGGVQGGLKLARGFLPVRTSSARWLTDPGLPRVIEYDAARARRETAACAAPRPLLSGPIPGANCGVCERVVRCGT